MRRHLLVKVRCGSSKRLHVSLLAGSLYSACPWAARPSSSVDASLTSGINKAEKCFFLKSLLRDCLKPIPGLGMLNRRSSLTGRVGCGADNWIYGKLHLHASGDRGVW